MGRTLGSLAAAALIAGALAGCGQSAPTVCHVRPSADGQTLIYSPAGCEHHLKGATLDIQSAP